MKNIGTFSYALAEIDWFWGYSCREAAGVLDNQKIAQQIYYQFLKETHLKK